MKIHPTMPCTIIRCSLFNFTICWFCWSDFELTRALLLLHAQGYTDSNIDLNCGDILQYTFEGISHQYAVAGNCTNRCFDLRQRQRRALCGTVAGTA
jgi:hypothetical protein